MPTTATFVTVQEYLTSVYRPDMDYVAGHLEDRHVGEREQGELQARLYFLLGRMRVLVPYIETRLRVSPDRYRVPDVCAYDKKSEESGFTEAPALCIEILSPEDRMSRILQVVRDYLDMGVPTVWVLDPLAKKAYTAEVQAGLHEVAGRIATMDGRVTLDLSTIFSDVDLF